MPALVSASGPYHFEEGKKSLVDLEDPWKHLTIEEIEEKIKGIQIYLLESLFYSSNFKYFNNALTSKPFFNNNRWSPITEWVFKVFNKSDENTRLEITANLKHAQDQADILRLRLNKPIVVQKSIFDAFVFNAQYGGLAYSISYDFCDISVKALEMLENFKSNYDKSKIGVARENNVKRANSTAMEIGPIIETYTNKLKEKSEKVTLKKIAEFLDSTNIPLPLGGTGWETTQVSRVIQKYEKLKTKI